MHVVLLLGEVAVVGAFVVLWALMCRRFFTWWAARTGAVRPDPDPGSADERPQSLPAGHEPPPGLGPLSPSERFLTRESARGVCELEQFLADQRMV